jgi:hypothetical protein
MEHHLNMVRIKTTPLKGPCKDLSVNQLNNLEVFLKEVVKVAHPHFYPLTSSSNNCMAVKVIIYTTNQTFKKIRSSLQSFHLSNNRS